MNYEESVRNTLSLLRRATETMLNERTILVDSVLHVRPRTDVAKLLAQVNPDGRKPSDSTVRRMITRTTLKMGLEELREKEGRRSFETCDKYKGEQCSRWIAANGGMPRLEQLADPSWDLQPYPPTDPSVGPTSTSETLSAKTMTSSKPTASNDEKSPLPERVESPLSEQAVPPPAIRENPEGDTSMENGKAPINRSVEEIQEEIRNAPTSDKKIWEETVFPLKCELFTVTNSRPPDKGDMNDIRGGLPGMWRDARRRAKKNPE